MFFVGTKNRFDQGSYIGRRQHLRGFLPSRNNGSGFTCTRKENFVQEKTQLLNIFLNHSQYYKLHVLFYFLGKNSIDTIYYISCSYKTFIFYHADTQVSEGVLGNIKQIRRKPSQSDTCYYTLSGVAAGYRHGTRLRNAS